MRICVIGGTGNISTSVVRLLLEQGHEVTCFNRGQSGRVPEGADVIQGDRRDYAAFERTMRDKRFDAAIDMLCFTREDAASNVRAFAHVQHFVQCSTVCTYGIAHDWMPVTEDHPLRPTTVYGRHKAQADAVFLEVYSRQGFPVTILKPSTTYGPRQGLLRQIAWEFSWIDRIRKGKPLLICGDGNALHQHLHVDDAALGFAHVIGKAHCIGQTYHLVDRGCITWADYHRTAMRRAQFYQRTASDQLRSTEACGSLQTVGWKSTSRVCIGAVLEHNVGAGASAVAPLSGAFSFRMEVAYWG